MLKCIITCLIIFRVKFEGIEPQALQIMGNIVEGSLELLDYTNEERLDCITFDHTFYGTDKTQSAILFNNGPEPVCFVAILNEDAVGQEAVSLFTVFYIMICISCLTLCQRRMNKSLCRLGVENAYPLVLIFLKQVLENNI